MLPLILQSDDSFKQIVNISSIGAHNTAPGMSAYETSKVCIFSIACIGNRAWLVPVITRFLSRLSSLHLAQSPAVISKRLTRGDGQLALLRLSEFFNAEYVDQGLVSYSVHVRLLVLYVKFNTTLTDDPQPGGVMTDMGNKMPSEWHNVLTDTPELAGDAIVWMTQERREWLRGRYISCNCEYLHLWTAGAKLFVFV